MMNPQSFIEDHYLAQKTRYQKRLLETRITFFVTLILLIIGVGIIFLGIVLLIIRNPVGGTATWSGSISSIITGAIFIFNNDTNRRLDETGRELASLAIHLDGIRNAEHFIHQINDTARKDKALDDLAKNSLKGLPQENRRTAASLLRQRSSGKS